MTVNHDAVGSSPTGGAIGKDRLKFGPSFPFTERVWWDGDAGRAENCPRKQNTENRSLPLLCQMEKFHKAVPLFWLHLAMKATEIIWHVGTIWKTVPCLSLFYVDREYWEKYPAARLDILTTSGEYEVLAAFYSEIYPQDITGAFSLLSVCQLKRHLHFCRICETNEERCPVWYGDLLLTLSTCNYHAKEGRFVVVARKIGVE